METDISKWDYYKVYADNKKGWKSVRVKKNSPFCPWCGSINCKHIMKERELK